VGHRTPPRNWATAHRKGFRLRTQAADLTHMAGGAGPPRRPAAAHKRKQEKSGRGAQSKGQRAGTCTTAVASKCSGVWQSYQGGPAAGAHAVVKRVKGGRAGWTD
jgi:hypothetical protein